MKRITGLIDYTIFFLLGFLSFLVLFESLVQIPTILQVVGRLHPMVLHLPIGFLIVLALLPLVRSSFPENSYHDLQLFLLRLSVLGLLFSAIAGFFLAQESGYQSNLVANHKWAAMASSYIGYGLLLLKKYFPQRQKIFNLTLLFNVIALLITGHLGGNLTHGKDYLTEPLKKKKSLPITPQSKVFEAVILPVLEAKCTKCHNPGKKKGGLSMVSIEAILKGGKNGPIWEAGQAKNSAMLQRIHLPLSAEEHMPPEGQTQLSKAEIDLIHHWIKAGAELETSIQRLNEQDSLYLALAPWLEKSKNTQSQAEAYAFEPAGLQTIKELNTPYRTVQPIAQGSPALSVSFFLQQAFQPSFLEELSAVRKQIVSINLSNMPIDDETLSALDRFPHLEKIILNGTQISGASLEQLSECPQLKEIAVSNTDIGREDLFALATSSRLEKIYAWETKVLPEDLPELAKQLPGVSFELGYQAPPGEMLQLSPPQLINDQAVLEAGGKVLLNTKFPGAEIRYTIDGSDPDSLSSPLFSAPLSISRVSTIKAQTFSPGWLSSEVATFSLFPSGKTPDTTMLLNEPNPQYKGDGASILTDKQKGKIGNFRSPAWQGYLEHPLSVVFYFGATPPLISEIVGSFGQNIGPEIFLPRQVSVYGGETPNQMQLLGRVQPDLPDGYQANKIEGISVKIKASNFSYYKLEALPHPSLPRWHQGYAPDRKTWIFIDEVFFY